MWPSLRGIVALLVGALVLAGCGEALPRGSAVRVVATITPLADWVREVGGARVQVQLIVPVGVDPRDYVPTPQQRTAIQTADLVLLNGLGLEPWIEEILDEVRDAELAILDISQFTGPLTERVPREARTDLGLAGSEPGSGRLGGEQLVTAPIHSPYLWLDPTSAMAQVSLIAQSLTRVDPDGIVIYRQNAARYTGELENLDSSIFRTIAGWEWRVLLSTDRFLYPFTRRYGLSLSVADEPVRVGMFPPGQPLLIDRLAPAPVAIRSTSARRPVVTLNPLAGRTYLELMQTNVQSMTLVLAAR